MTVEKDLSALEYMADVRAVVRGGGTHEEAPAHVQKIVRACKDYESSLRFIRACTGGAQAMLFSIWLPSDVMTETQTNHLKSLMRQKAQEMHKRKRELAKRRGDL